MAGGSIAVECAGGLYRVSRRGLDLFKRLALACVDLTAFAILTIYLTENYGPCWIKHANTFESVSHSTALRWKKSPRWRRCAATQSSLHTSKAARACCTFTPGTRRTCFPSVFRRRRPTTQACRTCWSMQFWPGHENIPSKSHSLK